MPRRGGSTPEGGAEDSDERLSGPPILPLPPRDPIERPTDLLPFESQWEDSVWQAAVRLDEGA